jgi:MFS family permease
LIDDRALGPLQYRAFALAGLARLSAALHSPLADRTGRKRVIVASTVAIGPFTILCASAQSLHTLEPLRFLTGLGLGTALPNALALITARHVLIFAALPAVCAVILLLSTANPIKRVARSSKSPLG